MPDKSELTAIERLIRRRHPLYEELLPSWEFLRAAMLGGQYWKEAALTPYGIAERPGDFTWRKKRAVGSNHVKHVIDEKRNLLFRPGVQRAIVKPEDEGASIRQLWDEFQSNIDRRGQNRDEFMRRVYELGSLYSWVLTLVDKPPADEGGDGTLAGEIENRAYPYCAIYTPQSVLDWSVDKHGKLNWILLLDSRRTDDDPMGTENRIEETYLLWTRESWRRIRVEARTPLERGKKKNIYTFGSTQVADDDTVRKVVDAGEETPHQLGEVPAVVYRDGAHPEDPLIGDNAMLEIANLSQEILNQNSNLQEQIYNTVFSVFKIVGGEPKKSKLRLGTRMVIQVPQGGDMGWLAADVQAVQYIMNWLDAEERKIYQKAKLRSGYGEERRPERMSGTAHKWDWRITNDDVADDGRAMGRFEEEVDRLFGKWEKAELTTKISYEENFSVLSAQESMQMWQMAAQTPLVSAAMAELQRRTVANIIPRSPLEVRNEIEAEIEKNPTPQPPASRAPVFRPGFGLNRELNKPMDDETNAQ